MSADIIWRLNVALINLTEDDKYTREAAAAMGAAMYEIARLRALMIHISKTLGYGAHIQVRYEGTTPLYTCGIHNIDMAEHGNRCPACDAIEGDPNV